LKSWHEEYERLLDLPSGYVRSIPKYSQTQKERAVEHYAEHGYCIAATVKALSYPSRDLLRSWINVHVRYLARCSGPNPVLGGWVLQTVPRNASS
jgi:hypothetical protein